MTDNRTTERVDHPQRVREAIDELMREKDATDNRTTASKWASIPLTAEQVREVLLYHLPHREYYSVEQTDAWQAIADELNAAMGGGTCKITATSTNNLMYPDYMTKWYELSCGHSLTLKGDEAPKWCAVCGKAVDE